MRKRRARWITTSGIGVLGLGVAGGLLLHPRTAPIPGPMALAAKEERTGPTLPEEPPPADPNSAVEAKKLEETVEATVTKPKKGFSQ